MSFQVKISCCVDEVDILRTSVRGLTQQLCKVTKFTKLVELVK